jgi:hypothetical protein
MSDGSSGYAPQAPIPVNLWAPSHPHAKQLEVLNDPTRFKVLRAGRKFRKTSLLISWLAEGAMESGLTCPYIAPNRLQAKNIAWRDHVSRLLTELRLKKVPHKVNEVELAITFPNGGRIQLLGVENQEALRGISNWGRVACDEYDDWAEDIWPTIIRPNLLVHKAPAIIAGTPKGMQNLYNFAQQPGVKEFHFTSHDNPDLDPEELKALELEYRAMGDDYYRQEILAEYVKPVGLVYSEWNIEHYKPIPYDETLPLYITFDWGINDPTAVIWIQTRGSEEVRIIDYYEVTDSSIEQIVQVINSKPYKRPVMYTGDPAGKARSLVTGTSVIERLMKEFGIYVRTMDGVKIPDQIRQAHTFMPRLWINSDLAEGFRNCILNYKYPVKDGKLTNQSNEIPIHDKFSHGMRSFEYWAVNYRVIKPEEVGRRNFKKVTGEDDLGFSSTFEKQKRHSW